MECPECEASTSDLTAMPYPSMGDFESFKSSLVVPYRCDECGTDFEVIYEADKIGY